MAHTQANWDATSGEGVILNKPVIVQNPMLSDLSMGNHYLTDLLDPLNPQDGATKNYVDTFVAGLSFKTAARVATTTALVGVYNNGSSGVGATFTTTSTGVLSIDGVSLVLNDRVVIKNQVSQFQNGIYFVSTAGAIGIATIFTRALDADTGTELTAAAIFTGIEGATNGGTAFVQSTPPPITVGTTALVWNMFLSSIYTAGTGIRVAANVIFAKLSEGVTGGQTAIGGTASEDTFTLQGSSSASVRTTNAPAIIMNSNAALGASTNVAQVFESIVAIINQSSTAGYTLIKAAATETATGSGTKLLLNLLAGAAGTTSKFSVANTGAVSIGDGGDISVGTATGTKIGTATSQKIGFFNTTPVVQQTGDISAALSILGLVTSPTLPNQSIRANTNTTDTFVLADNQGLVTSSNAALQTLTVPPNSSVAFPIGTHIDVIQKGAGKVTIAQGAGVTINSAGGNKSISGQYVGVTLIKESTNVWYLVGNLIT